MQINRNSSVISQISNITSITPITTPHPPLIAVSFFKTILPFFQLRSAGATAFDGPLHWMVNGFLSAVRMQQMLLFSNLVLRSIYMSVFTATLCVFQFSENLKCTFDDSRYTWQFHFKGLLWAEQTGCHLQSCKMSILLHTEQNIPTKFYPNSIISILIIIEWMHAHSHERRVSRKRDKNKDLNPMLTPMLTIDLLKRNHCGFSKVILNGSWT